MIDPKDWTSQESWVWERVTRGEIADFHEPGAGYGGPLDPKEPRDWPETRVLRPGFLETVLLHEPWRSQIPHQGLRIAGAWFRERVDLSNADLSCALWLDRSRFDFAVNLSGLNTPHSLSLEGSALADRLAMDGLKVGGDLFMRDQARFAAVRLPGAHIEGNVEMDGSTFTGKLAMDRLKVGGSLFMRDRARFAAVRLVGAHIEGQVAMNGSTFTDELLMDGLKVGGDLFMRDQARFAAVRLPGAHIEGELDMSGSTFTGDVRMDGLEVEGELFLDGTVFSQPGAMPFLHVGRLLSLNGTDFGSLDLTRARIDGTLRVAVAEAAREGRLDLTGATTRAIQDSPDGWPLDLRLDGFTYTHWDALDSHEGSPLAERPAAWFTGWLGRQTDFSPRPYEQLAQVLRETGHADKAKGVLFKARQWELGIAWRERSIWRWRWTWPAAKLLVIGHGYRVQWSLWWALGFVVLGAGVFWTTPAACAMNVLEMLAYSADMLLPIIELNKAHEAIVVCGWQLGYFYFHKVMGFVLASFLVAGLSGLAK